MQNVRLHALLLISVEGIPAYAKYHLVDITIGDAGPAIVDSGVKGFG